MKKDYYVCEEMVNGKLPMSLMFDTSWDLDIDDLVRIDIMLSPEEVYDSYMLDVYNNLESFSQENIDYFFHCEAKDSLLFGILELLEEDLVSESWDVKCASLSEGDDCLFLDLVIKVDPLFFSFSNTDFYLLFGHAVSEVTYASIRNSYVVKRAYQLHDDYYKG